MKNEKAREFWIDTLDTHWSDRPIEPFEGEPNRVAHVIDYKSYQSLQAKLDLAMDCLELAYKGICTENRPDLYSSPPTYLELKLKDTLAKIKGSENV